MWSVLLLGAPQILRDNAAAQIPRRKNRALLYYLAAHSKPLTRDQILALFFIDHERSAAQQILRTMLYDLRKQLGDALIVDDDTLALADNVFIDARMFDANPQPLTPALQLYRGDFLEGFTLDDVPEFDDWVARERERYRALATRGWLSVAEAYENERAFARALDALEHALAFDELNEQAQRYALRVQYLNGDRAGAIRRFEQFRIKLDEELGVPPMAETRAVYDAIITDQLTADRRPQTGIEKSSVAARPPSAAIAPAPLLPFTGREKELQAIEEAANAGKIIWIQGEPGIGKTRLAEEYIARAASNARVLRGGAHELETGLPYQPLIDALRGFIRSLSHEELRAQFQSAPVWLGELVRLLPELAALFADVAPPTTVDEGRVWEALHQIFQHLAQRQPVILFLDDAHWADAATIGFLNYYARQVSTTQFTVLLTARSAEPSAPAARLVETLTRHDKIERIALDVLSSEQVRDVAQQINPLQADALARWLMQNAEGNPFFVNELLRYAYRSGLLTPNGALDAARLEDAAFVPPTIQNLIGARLMRLDENARRVIFLAAAIGRKFDFELVARAAGISEEAALSALDVLRGAGLIVMQAGAFAFDHSLTMQVTRQEMGETRLRFLHRRIAESLTEIHAKQLEPVAGLIAQHFGEANIPDRAAFFARQAGDYASSLAAWADATAFYELALRDETDALTRAKIFAAMGEAQFNNGEFARATESYRASLQLAQAQRDFGLMERAMLSVTQSLFPQARYAEAVALAREMRVTGPPELKGAAEFAWGTALAVESAHSLQAEAHLRQAEKLLTQPLAYSTQISQARRKYQLAAVLGQRGDSAQAVAEYRAALALWQADPDALDLTRAVMLHNNLGYHLHLLGEQEAAQDAVRAGIRLTQEKGSTSHLSCLLSTSGEIALAQNDLDAAEKFFKRGLDVARAAPIPERIAGLTANLGLVAKARGENDAARALLSDALERADALGGGHLAVRIRIWLAPLLPRANARTRLREAREIAETNGYAGLLQEIDALEKARTR